MQTAQALWSLGESARYQIRSGNPCFGGICLIGQDEERRETPKNNTASLTTLRIQGLRGRFLFIEKTSKRLGPCAPLVAMPEEFHRAFCQFKYTAYYPYDEIGIPFLMNGIATALVIFIRFLPVVIGIV